MLCRRTANAGVLLNMDGVSILLDGVCREFPPYLGTPGDIRDSLYACPPDITAFTHGHPDHFDPDFAQAICSKTLRPTLGPEGFREACCEPVTVGGVCVSPIPSRHIGTVGKGIRHMSFLITGSKRVLFTGDAAPSAWAQTEPVDVLIAPFAYATTQSAWKTCAALADKVVLLHLPDPGNDPEHLWQAVRETAGLPHPKLVIPALGETIEIA